MGAHAAVRGRSSDSFSIGTEVWVILLFIPLEYVAAWPFSSKKESEVYKGLILIVLEHDDSPAFGSNGASLVWSVGEPNSSHRVEVSLSPKRVLLGTPNKEPQKCSRNVVGI